MLKSQFAMRPAAVFLKDGSLDCIFKSWPAAVEAKCGERTVSGC